MKITSYFNTRFALAWLAAGATFGSMFVTPTRADMYRMSLNAGGGVPAQAIILSTPQPGAYSTFSWYGLQGWYSLEGAPSMSGPWTSLGSTPASHFAWQITVPNPDPTNNSHFVRLNQANSFAGSGACGGCHGDKYVSYGQTPHSAAFTELIPEGEPGDPKSDPNCLICHTVGYNQPSGFADSTTTPHLENVGCENCHGAAGGHVNGDHSVIRPAVSIAPEVCGSCHQQSVCGNPQYTEYATSPHAQVTEAVMCGNESGLPSAHYTNAVVIAGRTLYGFYVTTNADLTLTTNACSGIFNSSYVPGSQYDPGGDRQASCGVCHSGATRMALLNDYTARQKYGTVAPLTLPTANDSSAWGPTCAVCHDPHAYYNTAQLRNPTWSTNYFTMPTTSDKRYNYFTNFMGVVSSNVVFYGTTFASLYDPNVNICGQCHNTRGARWDGQTYGLITNIVVGSPVTNIEYVDVYTYATNVQVFTNSFGIPHITNTYIYSYDSGRYATNVVAMQTNMVIATSLTTNINGFARAPHNSPQYNILIGILQPDYLNTADGKSIYTNGVLTNGLGIYATHSGMAPLHGNVANADQCATCHTTDYTDDSGNEISGHTFQADLNDCALSGCHTTGVPDIGSFQSRITNNIARVVDLLNRWATNNAPAIFTNTYSRYLQNSWEYTLPGVLASVTNSGPPSSDQLKLPSAILQARFNTYMARNDGSLGVHNPVFVPLLLHDAETKVLSQFAIARFTADFPDILAGGSVTFTNLDPQTPLAGTMWDFGDGTVPLMRSTATVTHQYTTAGAYSVTLTATDANGTETLTRNNYVNVCEMPVPSFTLTPISGTAPLTVNFTNTTVGTSYGKVTFYDNSGIISWSHAIGGAIDSTTSFTYTNAGTYPVVFQVGNPGGTVSVTNVITVN